MSRVGAALWRSLRAYQIYGANTSVGKTVLSTVLCQAVRLHRPKSKLWFLKPVSTGPLEDADDRHINRFVEGANTKCLFQFDDPVSPHLASQGHQCPADGEILQQTSATLSSWAQQGNGFAFVETAGGVLSPGPNGNLQADLYRPLRLPVVLVADPRLGGISASISAYESLSLRGYDVDAVTVFKDEYYRNNEYLQDFFGRKDIPLVTLPPPPARPSEDSANDEADKQAMAEFYRETAKQGNMEELVETLSSRHDERIDRLETMADQARDVVWYPFTQHKGMASRDITVIDSAYGDSFQTYKKDEPSHIVRESSSPDFNDLKLLQSSFDGSASWWTQGLGHGNPELSLTAAYAAGRYGHVMFPGFIHKPALTLSELLVTSLQNPRLRKVFYSDNGSTGMEVAVKMGLRAACQRYGWNATQDQIGIIGLSGSYHGDTMGVMDCSEPSTFNKKVEWYRGRGYWFNFPTVKMSNGIWKVEVPEELREELGEDSEFDDLNAVFHLGGRKQSELAQRYKGYIKNTLEDLILSQGKKFGAVIIEPTILGAGGMIFADPLFQNSLVEVVRENPQLFSQRPIPVPSSQTTWSGLPIIFDEVFTGLYRLGRRTSASFLNVDPDISVHAKLLTGGLIPLCTTLASEDIFHAFSSDSKADALLHGHSYTAHPVGCQVAVASLNKMFDMDSTGYWDAYKKDWAATSANSQGQPGVWSSWSSGLVRELSHADSVESIFALGSVLSITLRDQDGGGYTSNAARGLQSNLASIGDHGFNVHARVLGNIIYFMASLTSKPEELRAVEKLLRSLLL